MSDMNIDTQGEITSSTPLGTGPVNPKTGLDQDNTKFEIDASKFKSAPALSKGDLTGKIFTEDVLLPKSVYRVLGDNYHPEFDPEYNAQLLSKNQSNGGKFLSAINQAVVGQIAGGTIEGLGYLIDIPMMIDLAEGTEQEFGNAISDFGKKMSTWAEQMTPIYTDPTAPKFNPTSFEWWMSNAPSVASTISLVLPSMGGMAALQGIGKLVGLTDAMEGMSKFSKLFTTSFGQALMSRHMESLMEAQQTHDDGARVVKDNLYRKYGDQIEAEIKALPVFTPVDKELGPQPGQYTKEQYDADMNRIRNKWESKISQEADRVGAIGAANTYNKNWVMLLQDLPEYMLLNRFLNKGVKTIAKGAEEESAQVAKFLGMNMPAFHMSNASKQVANALGEGGEESYQFLVQQQSSEMLRNLADPDHKTSLVDELKKNYDNGEFWTNTWFGAIGAGFMQATMAGINAKALSTSGKARVKQLTEFSPLLNKLHSDYITAEESGDESAMKAAKQGFITAVAIKAEQLGNKEHLLNLIDALAKDDQNVLSNYEVDKSARDFFKGKEDIAKDLKDNINSLSKRYNDGLGEAKRKGLTKDQSIYVASALAHDNHMLEFLNKEHAESQAKVAGFDIEGYNKPNVAGEQLSDQGKQAFEVAHKKRDLQRRLAGVEKALSKEDITKEDKDKFEKRKTSLESKIELADQIITDLGKDKTVSAKQRKIDAALHGDLTKAEYSGTMPGGEVMNFIDAIKQQNAYEQEVEYFRDALDKDRKIIDKMVAFNKKSTTAAKPAEPPVEEKSDLDVGDVATYKGEDGVDKRGVVQNMEYAQQDTEGTTITPSAENVDNIVTIQPVNEKNEPVGPVEHVSGATVEKETSAGPEAVVHGTAEEDIESDEVDLPPEGPGVGDNLKDQNRRKTNSVNKGLIEFLSYADYEDAPADKKTLRKLNVRNKALDDFVSDPANQQHLSKATAKYSLDLKNPAFRQAMDKARKEKRMSVALLDAVDEWLNKGKKLSKQDREKLMKLDDFFGNMPVTVELNINGKKFNNGLYVHTLAKTRSRLTDMATMKIYAEMRKSLVSHLLDGDAVYTSGLSTSRGNPNNIDKTNSRNSRKADVKTVFGFKDYKDIELFVLKSSTMSAKLKVRPYENPVLHKDNQSVEEISFDFSSTGSVFVKTNKTINGQPFAVKLNKSFISEDHAFMIFNAFSTLAKTELLDDRKDNKGKYSGKLKNPNKKGYIGAYNIDLDPHEKNQKENSAAWNISAGEILDLLVVHGENLTDPNHPRYRFVQQLGQMSQEHKDVLESKRLFLQRGYDSTGNADGIYLCFGKTLPYNINTATKGAVKAVTYNRINLTSKKNKDQADAYFKQFADFVKWIQSNKTYAVHLENNRLGLKLNGGFLFGKEFRLGKKNLVVNPTDLPSVKYTYKVNSEILRSKDETYVEFLLKNGMVTTDMEAKDGKLFNTPFVHLGVNQNQKQDFGFKTGNSPITEDVPSSDLAEIEQVKDEEVKQDLMTEADKKITKGKRNRAAVKEVLDNTIEKLHDDKTKETLRDIMDDDDIVFRERPTSTTVYEQQDLDKEVAWVRQILNLKPGEIQTEHDISKMMLKGKRAWAVFSSNGILLYEAAEKGTIYHEAFHKVSLAYLTREERDAIYRNARLVYKMDKDQYSDKQIEEKLAESFREFVLTKQKLAMPSGIKGFFQRLYNTIKALFFRAGVRMVQSDIDRLFNQIYSGRFQFAKVRDNNIEPRLRSIMGENFNGINTYKDVTTYTKYLAKKLLKVNGVSDLEDMGKVQYEPLINGDSKHSLKNVIARLERTYNRTDISDSEKNNILKTLDLIKDSLGEKDEFGHYPKFGVWVKYIDRFLGSLGVTHRSSSEEKDDISDYDRRYEDLAEEEQGSRIDNDWNEADYYRPLKDNALSTVRFVVNTLHETKDVNETVSLVPFADGNKVWYKLLNDIIEYDNINDMIDKIRSIGESQNYYPYTELAGMLENATEEFRTKFQTSFEMYKHQHLTTSWTENKQSGEVNFFFDKSGHNELSRNTALKWNESLQYDRGVIQLETTEGKSRTLREKKANDKFFSDLVEEYQDKVLNYYADKNKDDAQLTEAELETLFRRISKILSKIHIDVNTDVLRHFSYITNEKRSLQNNLYKVINDILGLLGPDMMITEEGKPKNIITNRVVFGLSDAYATVNVYEESDMMLGPEGNAIWRYGKLNLATDNVRRIKRSQKWAAEKVARIGNGNSRILNSFVALDETPEAILEAKTNRDKFALVTMSNFKNKNNKLRDYSSRDYMHLNVVEDYLFKAYSILNGNMLPLPTLADRRTYYMMEGVKLLGMGEDGNIANVIVNSTEDGHVTFSDEVINTFYGYYLDEKERIDRALKVRSNYEEQSKLHKGDAVKIRELRNGLIRNYHYSGNSFSKENFDRGNAYHFIHFKGFESLKTPEEVRARINEVLNDRLQADLKFASDQDIIDLSRSKDKLTVLSKKFTKGAIQNYERLDQPDNFGVLSLMSKIMVNTQMGVIESEKIFLGDPALFSRNDYEDVNNLDTYIDLYKRWTGVGSTGTRLRYKYPGKLTTYNVSVFRTQKFKSLYYDPMVAKHTELYGKLAIDRLSEADKTNPEKLAEITKEAKRLATSLLKGYMNVDPTDGTAMISPEMFKEISTRMGLWTARMEKAFNILQSKESLSPEEIIRAGNIVFNPLKTMYIGHHNFNDVDLLIYNKMAMFTLFRQHVKGTHLEEVLDRMELAGNYADKGLEKIHVYNFDTAVKVGSLNGMNLFENPTKRNKLNDLAESFIFAQSFDNLKHQQVVEAHDNMKQTFGTAGFKIATADMFKDEVYNDGRTGKELLNELHHTRAVLSEFGLHRIDAKFGISNGKISNQVFIDLLKRDAESANKSFDMIQALKTDPATGEKYLEIDSFNDRKWIYARVKSIVDELTVDLNTPGTQLVQVTDYGMNPTADYSKELGFIRSKVGSTKVYEMECRVSTRLFKIPGHKITTIEEMQSLIDSSPNLFGYRVPTQGQNSLVKLKVVGLLPEQTGDIIQLPLEFTTVTGSDFDIDKLYVAMHNYRYNETNGKLEKIQFLTGDSHDEQRERYENKIMELFNIYKHSLESFRDVLVEDDNGKKVPIVSKYFGSRDIEINKLEKEYAEDKDAYNSESKNLLSKILTIKKNLAETKDELYATALETDLKDAQLKLEEIERKLSDIPYELELKKMLNIADMVSLEQHLIEAGKLKPFEEFVKLSLEEQNTEKATQNKLLDHMFTVLSDEKHFINMTTPLGAMTKILKDKAADYNKIYNPNESENAPALYTTTPSFQSSIKQKFSSAKFGIPPYALHNNHHALTQMAGVQMSTNLDLGFNRRGLIDLSRREGQDNKYITWWLSALIDAHVDVVKDPYITSLNVNESTHTLLNFLVRSGVGEIAFDLLNQPIARQYSYAFFNTDKNYGNNKSRISTIKETDPFGYVFDQWAAIAVNNGILTEDEANAPIFIKDLLVSLPKLLNKEQLLADAKESMEKVKSKEYYIRQLSILQHLKTLKEEANTLNNFVLASRVDTKKYGANPVEILYFLNNIRNVMYSERDSKTGERFSRFTNVNKILTINKDYKYKEGDTFIPTLIKNSMFKIYDILKNDSIYASYGFNEILEDLMYSTTGKDYNKMPMINTMMEELVTYFMSKFFTDKVNGLGVDMKYLSDIILETNKDFSLFNMLTSIKSGNDELSNEVKDNPLFENLIVDYSKDVLEDSNGKSYPYTYIKSPFRSKRDEMTKDEVIDGYKDLMASPNPKLNALGRFLYMYSFFTSGFRQRSISSFSSAIPLQMNREFRRSDGTIVSLNNHMKNTLGKLNTQEGYLEFLTEAKREIFTNMWATNGFSYELESKYVEQEYNNKDGEPLGIKVTMPMTELYKLHLGANTDRELIARPYVLVDGVLYEYIGYEGSIKQYDSRDYRSFYYASISKKGMGTNGHGTKGLFLYEYSVPNKKGDVRSILNYNNPTIARYTQEEKQQIITGELMSDEELNDFIPVPLEKQVVAEKGAGLADNFYTEDEAAKLMAEDSTNEDMNKAVKQRQIMERRPYSIRDLEDEDPTYRHNENMKASKDNLTTFDNPIYIDVDGSARGENGLGAGAYAEFNDKKYFMRGTNDQIVEYLKTQLEKQGHQLPDNFERSNPAAELMALFSVVDAFKGTSENIYITQDYSTLLYFVDMAGVAVNPNEVNKTTETFIQYMPDANKPHMVFLINGIRDRITQIKNNGGTVRIKYVASKTTKENRIADKIAKGEHMVSESRNDFRTEIWGKPAQNLDNNTSTSDTERGSELLDDICTVGG